MNKVGGKSNTGEGGIVVVNILYLFTNCPLTIIVIFLFR